MKEYKCDSKTCDFIYCQKNIKHETFKGYSLAWCKHYIDMCKKIKRKEKLERLNEI